MLGTGLLMLGAVLLLAYLGFIVALLLAGRRTQARALAGFIPDCLVLMRRLIGDTRLPRRSKLVLLALAAYLSFPLDLVPDFVPVVGHLDDVIVAALALRYALRTGGPELIREHWPGPKASLRAVLRVAYGLRPEPAGHIGHSGAPLGKLNSSPRLEADALVASSVARGAGLEVGGAAGRAGAATRSG